AAGAGSLALPDGSWPVEPDTAPTGHAERSIPHGPVVSMVASIPSPSRGVLYLGPLPLRAYAICILLGVLAAIWLARKRWAAFGFDPKQISDIAVWAVPAGLVGARLYHVITDYQMYTDDPIRAVKI